MDVEEFRAASSQLTDYIIKYFNTIRDRRVLPEVQPGYMRPLLPSCAPDTPDEWSDTMADIERVIMPGVTHWNSPHFHAYYPSGNSFPAILADMLSNAIGCVGFSWIASPASTELEVIMMDWLGQLLGLPQQFLAACGGRGGGVIQGTSSETTLVALLSARAKTLWLLKKIPNLDPTTPSKLVAYASDQAHPSVERAGMLAGVKMRLIKTDEHFSLRGNTLRQAILQDKEQGFIPMFVVGTLGAICACSFDNLREVGQVAQEFDLWFHVDAAYAGSAFVCGEFRYLMDGVELAQSFNFNPHSWLLVNFDCSAMWITNTSDLEEAFNVDPLYLKYEQQGRVPDYRHWQIPFGKRFLSLKLWFVMRMYGKQGLQAHIRKQVALAHQFESYVKEDQRFEIILPVTLGLVCFRLKKDNEVNESLLKKLNAGGIIHLVPSMINDIYFLRFAVCSRLTESHDVQVAWQEVQKQTELVMQEN